MLQRKNIYNEALHLVTLHRSSSSTFRSAT